MNDELLFSIESKSKETSLEYSVFTRNVELTTLRFHVSNGFVYASQRLLNVFNNAS